MKTNQSKSVETRGRKPILTPFLKKNILLFPNKTDAEIVTHIFKTVQPFLKNGVSSDPEIVKKQVTSLNMGVYKFRQKGIAEGKKIAFKGRKVNGELRTKWLKSGRHKLGAEAPKTPPIL